MSLVKAWKGDTEGNLIYKATAVTITPRPWFVEVVDLLFYSKKLFYG